LIEARLGPFKLHGPFQNSELSALLAGLKRLFSSISAEGNRLFGPFSIPNGDLSLRFEIQERLVVFSQRIRLISANWTTKRRPLASLINWYILPPAS